MLQQRLLRRCCPAWRRGQLEIIGGGHMLMRGGPSSLLPPGAAWLLMLHEQSLAAGDVLSEIQQIEINDIAADRGLREQLMLRSLLRLSSCSSRRSAG